MSYAILFSDGTLIRAGEDQTVALRDVKVTQSVNAGTELTIGSTCAGMLEATLFTPNGDFSVDTGEIIKLWDLDTQGDPALKGTYVLEKVMRPSRNLCRIVAYDAICRLDKDLTQWLAALGDWPYNLKSFADMVCQACGVTFANPRIPNEDWLIQKFTMGRVTGRQLMQWIGQACGRFCRATIDGALELAWYAENPDKRSVWMDEEPVFALNLAAYTVSSVSKVQICQSDSDAGITYGTGDNLYRIVGNPLLRAESSEELQEVIKTVYFTLSGIYYKPGKITLLHNDSIGAGDILRMIDRNGNVYPLYIMKKVHSGNLDTLEGTGSAKRSDSAVVNNTKRADAYGKLMELEMGMNGLRVENRVGTEKMASLELSVDGIKTRVSDQQEQLGDVTAKVTKVEQDASEISIKVQNIVSDGTGKVTTTTGYVFDETGLTVRKSGKQIKTQITEDGMTVYKNNNAVLTANSQGVDAVDLHASTYLIVGGRSRFENYGADRTGCFWIGG